VPRARRLLLVLAVVVAGVSSAGVAQADDARYALAGGCYGLKSVASGRFVVKAADGSYTASASGVGAAEPFHMQATALGRYLFYGRASDFMSAGQAGPLPGAPDLPVPVPTLPVAASAADDPVKSATAPSPAADWRVDGSAGALSVSLPDTGRVLAVDGSGHLVAAPRGAGRSRFAFAPRAGCATYPEVELDVTGAPKRGASSWGEVSGLIDAHMHMMAFEFLGGRAHCGRPWHPYGVAYAMVDCPDHEPHGAGAVVENTISYGNPVGFHDTTGWPTFKDWPNHASLTHEQSYYKWLERSWRAGQRVFVNLLVDNAVLCEAYPYKKNSCNEMDGVRLQNKRIRELQDYIDAQSGGPGKGWFRIVTTPYEARRVINQGKLAVILGIEVSKLFDCGVYNEQAECTPDQIDRRLDEVYAMGVRDMELVNKFDNALAGVAGDNGTTGVAVNGGNKIETGKFWQMQHCDGHNHVADRSQPTAPGVDRDALAGNILDAFGGGAGTAPAYAAPPHCNTRGLTALGAHLVKRMIEKRMVIDPDHLSVRARQQLLDIVEKARYSGIVSSHSWSTPDSIPRIYRAGGFVTPYAGASKDFIDTWREEQVLRDPRFYGGVGWGADMNGFGAQGGPRNGPNPVTYPFKNFDGTVTVGKQRSGQRVYDINVDGVAHYGLYPDWVEDLRKQAGEEIIRDLARGPEAYLQMWERADGIPTGCRPARARLTRSGLAGARLNAGHASLLRRAGQPKDRGARVWSYCVSGQGRMTATLAPAGRVALVASTAPGHKARGVRTGMKAKRVKGAKAFGRGVRIRRAKGRAFVYGVRGGKVRYVAVASGSASRKRAVLRRYLRLAGLR
jgi:microsomal dipeptidase-like Zn-dependent dipeptidase